MIYKTFFYNEDQPVGTIPTDVLLTSEQRQHFAQEMGFIYDRFAVKDSEAVTVVDSDFLVDMVIVGGQEIYKVKPVELVAPSPKYIVIEDVNLLDAETCKTYPNKTLVKVLKAGTKILLLDCDPDAFKHPLAGIRTTDLKYEGYVDKTKIKIDPEA